MTIIANNHRSKWRHEYPPFDARRHLQNYIIAGDPSIGFVHTYRSDIYIITDQTHNEFNPVSIIPKIELGLSQGKKIALMWYDEDFMVPNKHSDVLNKALEPYAHESVYLCSNLSGTNLLQYTSPTHRNLPIKVLFVPWTILTAVAQMTMAAKKFIGPEQQSSIQFGCFHNRPDTHKQQLIAALLHRQLSSIGHIVMDGKPLNQSCQLVLPFADTIDRLYWTSSHDMKKCFAFDQATQTMLGQWFVSQQRLNVMISDIPLIIGADTTLGIFPISDKLYWPVIAGRMLMLHSRAYMYQEFKNLTGFDCGSYLDLEFDGIEGWDQSAHSARLECMLDKNLYVIKHARDKWPEVAPQLQHLASNFANMIYQHFCDGLDQIQ